MRNLINCRTDLQDNTIVIFQNNLLGDILVVKILDHLFKIGEIDRLYAMTEKSLDISVEVRKLPPPVYAVLRRANILNSDSRLSASFCELIQTRNTAFRSRIDFLLLSITDFIKFGENLLWKPESFMAESHVFKLFDYAAGFEATETARAKTALWCQYVSALTEDESEHIFAALERSDIIKHNIDVLECGGNTGTFARNFIKRFPCKSYTIIDIPNVCALGLNSNESCEPAIEYIAADMFCHNLKIGLNNSPDLIIFKSVLHDWPRERLRPLLTNAIRAVSNGGAICIIERSRFDENAISAPILSDVCNIVFSPFYRGANVYTEIIKDIDASIEVSVECLWIEMEWFILYARRKQ